MHPPSSPPRTGLAVTSLILGILSLLTCLAPLTGVPAVICGHLARGRARRSPETFGGAGMALTGIITGYVSLALFGLVVCGLIYYFAAMQQMMNGPGQNRLLTNPVTAVANLKGQSEEIVCGNNLKQIGLAFRIWAIDNDDKFPFQVSTNRGGTLECCDRRPDGFEKNPVPQYQGIAQELMFPAILHCPADKNTQPANSFPALLPANITYQLRTGAAVEEASPAEVLALCPIHKLVLYVDGSVAPGR